MCKGGDRDEESYQFGFSQSDIPKKVALSHATMGLLFCELCSSRASLYCQADDAFLCRKCDNQVHGANFLALRHIRCFLCATCQNLTERYLIRNSVELMLPTIMSWTEKRQCNSKAKGKCTGLVKKWPILFL